MSTPDSLSSDTLSINPLYVLQNHEDFHEAFSPALADAIAWVLQMIAERGGDRVSLLREIEELRADVEHVSRERDHYKQIAKLNAETIKAMCAENSRGL